MDHTSSFKDVNREGKKKKNRLNYSKVGNELAVLFYYFVKMQQQVTFTDNNKPSLHHHLIKPTLNSLINKITTSINLRLGG